MPDDIDTATAVNPQITDAVTQTKLRTTGQAPAQAVAAIYAALAHAVAALLNNAVAAQQQTQLTADAALALGIARLYDQSAVADGAPLSETNMSPSPSPTSPDQAVQQVQPAAPSPEPAQAGPESAGASVDAPIHADAEASEPNRLLSRLLAQAEAEREHHARFSGVSSQIEHAVKLSNEQVLGAAGDVAYAQRASTDAFVAGLRQVSDAQHRQRMQLLQASATAVCLDAMLKSPERAGDYDELLQVIKHLV